MLKAIPTCSRCTGFAEDLSALAANRFRKTPIHGVVASLSLNWTRHEAIGFEENPPGKNRSHCPLF